MFELFVYVYSCNALSARFFAVDRALNSYFMIMIKCTPQVEQEVKFVREFLVGRESWRMGVLNLAVIACVLRTKTEKIVNFMRKKMHPRRENPGYACGFLFEQSLKR